MLNLSTLYRKKAEFDKFVGLSLLDLERECLIRIYTAEKTMEEAQKVAQEIKEAIPNGKIIGCSASGVILKGKQYDDATLVIIEQFLLVSVKTRLYNIDEKTPEMLAQEFSADYQGDNVALMHILAGDNYSDIFQYVEKINNLCPDIKLTGGAAGDVLSLGIKAFVFDETGAYTKGIIVGGLIGKIYVSSRVSLTCDPISPVYTVTKCMGSKVLEIEGKSATVWSAEQLGMDDMREYRHDWQVIAENDSLIRFPMILEGHSGAARFIKYDSQDMSLYFSKLDEGIKFRVGYTSPTKCVQESLENCQELSKVPVESLFCYSCLFRKLYLENCADWELRPFADYGICGAFMMGEIGYINGRNEFLNGACSIVTCAEREHYITPDFNVFEDLHKIKDDSNKLNSFIIIKQSTAMSQENKEILNKLLVQQQHAKEQLYIDSATGLQNAIQFAQDNSSRSYDKICFIQVENSPLIINHFGKDYYIRLLRMVMKQMDKFLAEQTIANKTYVYAMNDSVVFIAANAEVSKEEFTDFSRSIYSKFKVINLGGRNELFINRFAVVFGGSTILEKGLAILQSSHGQQSYFTISQISVDSYDYLEDEIEMLHIICTAIDKNLVIPYFQGIYDNQSKKIVKYEALMRLKDEQGNVYTPAQFMPVAKKYQLYISLSHMMIDIVMDKFNKRNDQVSLNLSVRDVSELSMRNFILEKLKAMDNCENFIFEFLEDEQFLDFIALRNFITELRECGAKISVDDFGTGYSSFLEIVRMEPDYIKVDGSIIKTIVNDEISRKVLYTIAGLATHLGAKVVAEFVENKEIQNCLLEMEIPYSQGYYFSVPGPLD